MNAKYVFYNTLGISIIVQLITFLLELGAFFVKVPTAYLLLKQLLLLDVIVQFIEGSFYFWLVYNVTKVLNITPKRYIDWVITTPTMLITLMIYLIYLNKKVDNSYELEFFNILKENSTIFITVLLLNWLMLFFGYLGEIKTIPSLLGVFLGFIPFLIYYYIIYVNFVTQNTTGQAMFWYFVVFWSLYGIAAGLPYYVKNACYNILDLFSKNFFGVFLGYIIFSGNY